MGGGRGLRRLDSKNGKAPPCRNLWLGNLSHGIIGDDLINPFLQFGELESVVFHADRSYAFINSMQFGELASNVNVYNN